MASREFKVRAWKQGQVGTLDLRISAESEDAARRVAEGGGWIVEAVEPDLGAGPATLESLAAEVREMRSRVESLHGSFVIRHPIWTVILGLVVVQIAWLLIGLLLRGGHF